MLRRILSTTLVLATLAIATSPEAAFDIETSALPESRFELVIIEAEGCIYCQIFRRDVVPSYELSPRAREVPLRFVDINEAEASGMPLAEPVEIVPTAVLMHDQKEVGRIAGYVGPEAFFHSVNRMMAGAEAD